MKTSVNVETFQQKTTTTQSQYFYKGLLSKGKKITKNTQPY